jgi:carbamoyl-phosphate synthase/aspartate carbamoyltransferase
VKQYNRPLVEEIIAIADKMRTNPEAYLSLLHGKVLATLFYEPSTRTSSSFNVAMQRLGGRVFEVDGSTSSIQKGETLTDTIRCLQCYSDAIVLRHPSKGAAEEASRVAKKPIINAGDGTGEHPTQALLDAYTILHELGGIDGKKVCFVGDLKNGRTVHSLSRLLSLFSGVQLIYVSPPSLAMPEEVKADIAKAGLTQTELPTIQEAIKIADVVYVTRVQKERFTDLEEYERVKGTDACVVTAATMKLAQEKMIVMHPLPRIGEISEDVDDDPRAAYFKQMENGMYVRMALLAMVMGKA